jgi:hypothetical protein
MNVQETTGETTTDQGRIAIVITKSETDRQKVTNSLLPTRRTWSMLAVGSTISNGSWQYDRHWQLAPWSHWGLATWLPLAVGNMITTCGWQHGNHWWLATWSPLSVGYTTTPCGWQHDDHWWLATWWPLAVGSTENRFLLETLQMFFLLMSTEKEKCRLRHFASCEVPWAAVKVQTKKNSDASL